MGNTVMGTLSCFKELLMTMWSDAADVLAKTINSSNVRNLPLSSMIGQTKLNE